jgi:hypothetical protein
MNNNWIWIGLGAVVLYYLSQNSVIASSAPIGVTSYYPTANAQANQFSCPSGTSYVDSGEQASGGGYCEAL